MCRKTRRRDAHPRTSCSQTEISRQLRRTAAPLSRGSSRIGVAGHYAMNRSWVQRPPAGRLRPGTARTAGTLALPLGSALVAGGSRKVPTFPGGRLTFPQESAKWALSFRNAWILDNRWDDDRPTTAAGHRLCISRRRRTTTFPRREVKVLLRRASGPLPIRHPGFARPGCCPEGACLTAGLAAPQVRGPWRERNPGGGD